MQNENFKNNQRIVDVRQVRKFICFVLISALAVGALPLSALATGPTNFTYTYNQWGSPIPSPDAYRVTAYILGQHLEFNGENVGAFREPQDLHVHGSLLYLVDTGNNRIIVLDFAEETTVVAIHSSAMLDGAEITFNRPYGIFVSEWYASYGEIWLADTMNQRVLHMDADWNVLQVIGHPGIYGTSLLEEDSNFLPNKVVVDFSGRLFVQTRHVNRGLMEFDRDGTFAGYMGAPEVVVGPADVFWRAIATQAQRDQRLLNVPVEYNNLYIDSEGFIFVTTAQEDIHNPVSRLNAMGDDIMIRNGWTDPIGDVWWGTGADRSGPSELVAVTTLPHDIFVVFDRNRGRLFAYDSQGHLLYVWGGPGNREGFFTFPTALASMGYTIFALDGGQGPNLGALTRFDLTEYGELIKHAFEMYQRGQYEESYSYWNDVLRMNGNFGLAYIGIARAHLRMGNYREAMHFFRLQSDYLGYGRAFNFYRRIWMEQNFWILAVVVGVAIVVPPVIKIVLKLRREINES
ncbi:MAG: hypothetical protein FWC70_01845 [Defluviitaleaceae bacterium]|nr:hypothetical protein [Defluviitaleaceae bacterium]